MVDQFRIIILPQASTAIVEIWHHICAESPQNARLVTQRIFDAIDSLEYFPRRCRVHRSTKDPNRVVRALSVLSYIIYYRIHESERVVEVLTIRHGAQKQPRRFP